MRKLSSDCDLFELHESLLRDMLIIGLNNKSLLEHSIREPNLDLTKTKDTCRTVEVTGSYANVIQNGNPLVEIEKMKFENALCNIKPNLELSLPELSTNVSSVHICTKQDPVLLMENLVTSAKRRDIFESVVQILIQKLTLSNKIWIIVTQTQNFSTIASHFL